MQQFRYPLIIIFGLAMAPAAFADGRMEATALHATIVEKDELLVALLKQEADPAVLVKAITDDVTEPLDAAEDAFFQKAVQNEALRVWEPCIKAAYELSQTAKQIQRYLQKLNKATMNDSEHIEPYRQKLAACEALLAKN